MAGHRAGQTARRAPTQPIPRFLAARPAGPCGPAARGGALFLFSKQIQWLDLVLYKRLNF